MEGFTCPFNRYTVYFTYSSGEELIDNSWKGEGSYSKLTKAELKTVTVKQANGLFWLEPFGDSAHFMSAREEAFIAGFLLVFWRQNAVQQTLPWAPLWSGYFPMQCEQLYLAQGSLSSFKQTLICWSMCLRDVQIWQPIPQKVGDAWKCFAFPKPETGEERCRTWSGVEVHINSWIHQRWIKTPSFVPAW